MDGDHENQKHVLQARHDFECSFCEQEVLAGVYERIRPQLHVPFVRRRESAIASGEESNRSEHQGVHAIGG